MGVGLTHPLAAIFFALSLLFVWRSFYGMWIRAGWARTISRETQNGRRNGVDLPAGSPVDGDSPFRRVGEAAMGHSAVFGV
jgi:hypothetical protein